MAWDLRTVRIVRFALGTTFAAALAYAYEWPLFFLTPVLTISFLAAPLPGLSWRRFVDIVGYVVAAMVLGAVFTLFLLPFPMVYAIMLGLALFQIYYLVNRRGPFMLALMSLLAVLILPMLAVADEQLAVGFAGYFVLSTSLAVLIYMISHLVIPNPPGSPKPPATAFQSGYSAPAAAAALKSTLAVLPLVLVFIVLELHSQLLVMVFVAIFSLSPNLSTSLAAGAKSVRSTLLGCLAAIVVYWLLVAVPEFHFFIVLWLVTMLIFGRLIFSDHPMAKYMGSAASAMAVLVSGSLAPNADFVDKMVERVTLIMLATLYVVAAIAVIDRYLFGGKK